MSITFNRDSFVGVSGSQFTLTAADGQTIQIELDEVSELKETSSQRSFSLVFTVPEGYRVEQGLYDIEHETLDTMQIFLVPIGMNEGRQELEAVFNFLITKEGRSNG